MTTLTFPADFMWGTAMVPITKASSPLRPRNLSFANE